jgi:hypothetical protein
MTRQLMVVVCVLVLAGCADADTTGDAESVTTAPQPSTEGPVVTTRPADQQATGDEDTAGSEEAPSGAGGDGPELIPAGDSQVAINGEPVAANSLLRCEPFSASEELGLPGGEDSEVLDLQVLGDGYILFIGVSSETAPGDIQLGSQSASIQGRAVGDGESTGVFETSVRQNGDQWFGDGAEPADGPLMEWTGDRVAGSATLADTFEAADPIEVTFDVVVPEEVQDCSL